MNNWKLIVQSVNYLKGVKIEISTTEEKYQVKQKLQGWKGNFWKYCGFFNSIDFISLIDMEKYIKRILNIFVYIQKTYAHYKA